jgi:hypothetical protein
MILTKNIKDLPIELLDPGVRASIPLYRALNDAHDRPPMTTLPSFLMASARLARKWSSVTSGIGDRLVRDSAR